MRVLAITVCLALAASACSGSAASTSSATPEPVASLPAAAPTTASTVTSQPTTPSPPTTMSPFARPDWLGTRLLTLRDDGFGEVIATPPEMVDRRFETLDLLQPPEGEAFEWAIIAVPDEVLARSSWTEECPVAVSELAYVTVSHWGFDERFHTGELLVNASIAEDVVEVFRQLHESRFPVEQMRVIRAEEIDAHPTGDFNETTSFVCRPAVGSNNWSQHAYGLAIDINPFHNPYLKADLVLPELASAYTDRQNLRPGMVVEGDIVTGAFFAIGFGWGGHWNSLKDWMHFSMSGN
ncbi:MAG: M15 family metallopeptidase [Acidimicrobiia bacterium]|nr:M15 family metallopeptidase [Acidimicrobiia bacterium]